jgi:serine/threonine protein kinase
MINYDSITFEKPLGEGSCGVVYKGRLNHTDVAIKTAKALKASELDEFLKEAKIMTSLHHPNDILHHETQFWKKKVADFILVCMKFRKILAMFQTMQQYHNVFDFRFID